MEWLCVGEYGRDGTFLIHLLSAQNMEFENWRRCESYRLIGEYNGEQLELSSNIPTIDLAEKVRKEVERLYPFFDRITVREYITYQL